MRRRSLLLALLGWPLLARAGSTPPLYGLYRRGSGSFRRFGFLVYEATLWSGDESTKQPGPPLALRLDYRRSIAGRDIAEASVQEMRKFVADTARLKVWGEQMARMFPDVRDGDHLLGVWRPDGAYFYQGERLIGSIRDAEFARAFFAIWLDPLSSAPGLRAALLEAV